MGAYPTGPIGDRLFLAIIRLRNSPSVALRLSKRASTTQESIPALLKRKKEHVNAQASVGLKHPAGCILTWSCRETNYRTGRIQAIQPSFARA